jgi:8-oxo-dGTP pyrophosphatase MutT (NUDIX family)
MKTKVSYGIALSRYNENKNNNVEILLIKKRYTYAFQSFVMGNYKNNDIKYIKYLFNNMCFSEKIDIIGMQFNQMWRRIWLNNPQNHFNISDIYQMSNFDKPIDRFSNAEIYKVFFQKKNRFEKYFLKDGGKKLRQLIAQSQDSEIIWEIPKGRSNENETNIDSAIREFYEETSISSDKYRILYDVEPIIDSFVDNDIIYKNIFYLAVLRNEKILIPKINYKNFSQVSEVEQIKWISLEEIKFLNLENDIKNRLVKLYQIIIFKFKNYINS